MQVSAGADLKSLSPIANHCHLVNITITVCLYACAGPLTVASKTQAKQS